MTLGLIDHRISHSLSNQTVSARPPSHGDCSVRVLQATYGALAFSQLNMESAGLVSIPEQKDILYHLLRGIDQLISEGVKVICLPLGFSKSTPLLEALANTCEEKEILLIAAVGNKGPGKIMYPAAYPSVLAVGATHPIGNVAAYSGSLHDLEGNCVKPEVLTKGEYVPASFEHNERIAKGTSIACARVAALAKAMLSVNPELGARQLKTLICISTNPLYGSRYGGIDAQKAMALAKSDVIDAGNLSKERVSEFHPQWIDQRLRNQCEEAAELGRRVQGLLATGTEAGMSRLCKDLAIEVNTDFAHFHVARVEAQPELFEALFTHRDLAWASAVDVNYFDL